MKYWLSKKEKKQVTFYCSKSDFELFQERYPNCCTLYLSRCVKAALVDQDFFASVFFNPELSSR